MNKKTFYFVSNIISIVFLLLGILNVLVALTSLFGIGTALVGTVISRSLGVYFEGFPFLFGVGGAVFFGTLGAAYLAASIGLYKFKKWTVKSLIALGIIGILDFLFSYSSGAPKYLELFWVGCYFVLAAVVRRRASEFKN